MMAWQREASCRDAPSGVSEACKKAVFTDLNARQSAAGKSKSETKGKQLDLPVHEIGSSRSR